MSSSVKNSYSNCSGLLISASSMDGIIISINVNEAERRGSSIYFIR